MAPRTLSTNALTYAAPLLGFYVANQLDSTNDWIVWGARLAFAVQFLVGVYVYSQVQKAINTADDQTVITYVVAKSIFAKKTKKKGGAAAADNTKSTTIVEYERGVLSTEFTRFVLGALVCVVIHLFGAFSSLIVATVTGPVSLFDSPLVKAHLLHEDLARPFTEPETLVQTMKNELKTMKDDFQKAVGDAPTARQSATAAVTGVIGASGAASAAEAFRRARADKAAAGGSGGGGASAAAAAAAGSGNAGRKSGR